MSGEDGATTITTKGGTLQMVATVTPSNASNKAVTWSVEAGTGTATISNTGLLTAVTNGTVTVRATAKDGSGVVGKAVITISGQEEATEPVFGVKTIEKGSEYVTAEATTVATAENTITIGGTIPYQTESILGHEPGNLYELKITLENVAKDTAAFKSVGSQTNTYAASDNWMDGDDFFYFVGKADKDQDIVITIDNDGDWETTADAVTYTIKIADDVTLEAAPDTEAPVLGEVTLTNDDEGNLVLKVIATDNGELASLEVDHSLDGQGVPEFTVGTENVTDPTTGASSTFDEETGTWTLNFGDQMSALVREKAGEEMTFYFVIKDVAGNQFGDMYNVTSEMTRTLDVPAAPANPQVANVGTLAEFKAALVDSTKSVINLTAGFETTEKILIDRAVTINGGNKAISFTGDAEGWKGNYVLHVYDTTGVTIKDIKLTGGDAALLVNGSEVTLEGSIDVSGNEFGGIEVSQGSGVTQDPKLTVAEAATITYTATTTETPVIWIDGKTDNNDNWVVGATGFTEKSYTENNKEQYWFSIK